jgi:hypothetical protein
VAGLAQLALLERARLTTRPTRRASAHSRSNSLGRN